MLARKIYRQSSENRPNINGTSTNLAGIPAAFLTIRVLILSTPVNTIQQFHQTGRSLALTIAIVA